MQKPTQPILSEPFFDYGIAERVARRLERSPLHVVGAYVCMGAPAGFDSGLPEHLVEMPGVGPVSMFEQLALVTDGRRGWLVLASPAKDWDVEVEYTDFIEQCRSSAADPPPCVVRAASFFREEPVRGLDLRDVEAARAVLEAEYERCFASAEPANVDALLEVFRDFGYSVTDEAQLRDEMNETVACA